MTEPRIAKKTHAAAKAVSAASRQSKETGTGSKVSVAGSDGKSKAAVATKIKHKLVRDSFTIPQAEYEILEGLKVRAANLKRPTKKSELLRAGVAALHAMTDKAFLSALNGVTSLKTGRPKDENKATSKT